MANSQEATVAETPGQIAYTGKWGDGSGWPLLSDYTRSRWEAAAQAVMAAQPGPAASWELVERALKGVIANFNSGKFVDPPLRSIAIDALAELKRAREGK